MSHRDLAALPQQGPTRLIPGDEDALTRMTAVLMRGMPGAVFNTVYCALYSALTQEAVGEVRDDEAQIESLANDVGILNGMSAPASRQLAEILFRYGWRKARHA